MDGAGRWRDLEGAGAPEGALYRVTWDGRDLEVRGRAGAGTQRILLFLGPRGVAELPGAGGADARARLYGAWPEEAGEFAFRVTADEGDGNPARRVALLLGGKDAAGLLVPPDAFRPGGGPAGEAAGELPPGLPANLVVLGMHRSGTSALTGALTLLGYRVGEPEELLPADPSNPAGYFERVDVVRLNELLLERLGGSWRAPPPLPPGWAEAPELEGFREWARRILARRGAEGAWVWKDPRLCLTWELWEAAGAAFDGALVCARDPGAVGASLAQRDGMGKAEAAELWERYLRGAVAASRGRARAVVWYEGLAEDPAGALGRALEELGGRDVAGSLSEVEAALRAFVRPAREAGTEATRLAPDILKVFSQLEESSG